jgi:hypothetical protein
MTKKEGCKDSKIMARNRGNESLIIEAVENYRKGERKMKKRFLMAVFAVSCLLVFGGQAVWADFEIKGGRLTAVSDVGKFDVNTNFEAFVQVEDAEGNFPDPDTVKIEVWYVGQLEGVAAGHFQPDQILESKDGERILSAYDQATNNAVKMEGVVFKHYLRNVVFGTYDPSKAKFTRVYRFKGKHGDDRDEYWTFSNGVTAWKDGMYIYKVEVEGVSLPDYAFYYVGPRYNLPEPGEFVGSWINDQRGEGDLFALWAQANGFMQGSLGFKTIIRAEVFRYQDKGAVGVVEDVISGHGAFLIYSRSLIELLEEYKVQGMWVTVWTMTNDETASIKIRNSREFIGLPDETTEVRLPLAARIAAEEAAAVE